MNYSDLFIKHSKYLKNVNNQKTVDSTHCGISYQLNDLNGTISCNSKESVTNLRLKLERNHCVTLVTSKQGN